MRRGYTVSIPMDVAVYDIVVDSPHGLQRVQIKSTTQSGSDGRWTVGLTQNRFVKADDAGTWKIARHAYQAGALDYFFIVCGDGRQFLIPAETVAGKATIVLGAKYANFEISP